MGRFFPDSFEPTVPSWRPLLLGLGLCLLVGGCAETSFVGRQYDNFTAYYNTFYNARNAFEEGVQAMQDRDRPVDRTEYLSVFWEPGGTSTESSFEEAIQKSADVLREHPNSKWVDDALLLIGKSYFYQQNYAGAAQKFREVLALDGERKREARFWLARTLVTNERYSEAEEVLLGVEEEEQNLQNTWTARLFLVRGELLVRQQQWSEAEAVLVQGLRGELPDETAARGAFLLGQVRETLGEPDEARAAYRRAHEYDPPYELSFTARLSEIELQGEHGSPNEALDRLRSLERDDKNRDKQGEMALVRARIYRAQGEPDRARAVLRNVLYENDTRSSSATGRLHYDLASLYRDEYKDFNRAAAHFDTASTNLSRSGGQQQGRIQQNLPAAPVDAASEADRYRTLAERSQEVARLDSLLRVGRMSDEEFQAFVEQLERRREEERLARQEDENDSAGRRLQSRGQIPGQGGREQATAVDTRDSDAGFLFHRDPAQVQQGRQRFAQIWGDRPRVDNWRRRNAMQTTRSSSTQEEPPSAAGSDEEMPGGSTEVSSGLNLSDIPRDSVSQAEMEAERAMSRYELANSLFLAAGRPDSAATWYRRILQENGDHPVARRALYALAEAYRAQGDTTAAQQTYRRLIEQYPGTALAERGRERLGRREPEPVDNRPARADTAYAHAYERWQRGDWRTALDSMFTVVRQYPQTDAAPRALLASSIIYWQRVQVDSTAAPHRRMTRYIRSISRDSTRSSIEAPRLAEDSLSGDRADSTGWRLDAPVIGGEAGDSVASMERAEADSLRTTADTTIADSLFFAKEVDPYAPLDTLLSHLVEQYPEAPQVERARSMMEMLEERRTPADSVAADSVVREETPDSAAIAASDQPETQSSAAENPPRTDTLRSSRTGTRGDKPEASSGRREEPLPAPTAPSQGDGGEGETWTLFVERYSEAEGASALIETLEQQLGEEWTIEVVEDPEADARPYLLVIGEFESEKAALQAQEKISSQMGGSLQVRRKP